MSMKPRLGDKAHKLAPNLVTDANCYDGSETNPNVAGTVSAAHPETNKKLAPNLVSGPNPGR